MRLIVRDEAIEQRLPGRIIQSVVGKTGVQQSRKMTMGFGHYSAASGPMEPHHHAEEIVYIVNAERGYVRWGPAKDNLTQMAALEAGMTLHFPELEWHVFEYEEGGFVDIIFFYGQTDNIRPEEIQKEN
jgi:hypothetical protein